MRSKRAAVVGAAAVLVGIAAFSLRGSPPRARMVVERLFDGLEPEPAGLEPRHHWSGDDLGALWTRVSGERDVTLRSPQLELSSADELDSIVLRFASATPADSTTLAWSTGDSLAGGDLLRNRRQIRPSEDLRVVVRGKDLRGESPSPLRHLFLHLSGVRDPRTAIESISVVTTRERGSGRARVAVDGEMREVLFLRTPGEWSRDIDIPPRAELRFGIHVPSAVPVRARVGIDLRESRETLFDEEIAGGGFRDFVVPLPEARGARLTLSVESALAAVQVLWSQPLLVTETDSPPRPNVVLYVVDSLRAVALSLYGAEPTSSPFLDGLSRESLVVERCYAAASWTKPSVASLLTSLYPQTHRLGARHYADPLPDGVETLPDYFAKHGYVTAQFSANPFSGTLSNLDRGFDQYFAPDSFGSGPSKPTAERMNDRILPWIEGHARDRFFLYVHSMDPHAPYESGGYDSAVRSADAQIGRLYRGLVELGLAEDTLFVVTADHGEAFGEHGPTGHGNSVYDEEVRVPLLLHWKGHLAPRRIERVAHHVDVLPTLLDYASVPFDRGAVEGRSLASAGREGPTFVSRFVYPEDLEIEVLDRNEAHAVIELPWKLIVREGGSPELYHLATDPGEKSNLADRRPDLVRSLNESLERFLERQASGPLEPSRPQPPSPRVLDRLRSLGYLR